MQKLTIHKESKMFMHEDGTPFFYLGDTAWDLVAYLTKDEIKAYMSIRAKQGFTAIQCYLLGNTATVAFQNKQSGRSPLYPPHDKLVFDTEGDDSWWHFVDFCVDCAEKYGLYMAMNPMACNKYDDPESSVFKGYDEGYIYGKFLGDRYKDKNNIIWVLGGDVHVKPFMLPIFQGLADGLKAGEREDNHHLIGFHPYGISDSVTEVGDPDYLDFHTCQTGHTVLSYHPYRYFDPMIKTGKPYFDFEPHYEDHVANWIGNFRRWDASDIREGAYESVLAGAAGHSYGNPIVAFFMYEPISQYGCDFFIGRIKEDGLDEGGWIDALRHEGAESLKHLKALRLSRPYFELRPAQELVLNSEDDLLFGRISAARGDDYAFIYTAYGREIKVDCSQLGAEFIRASWFNPRTGEEKEICYVSPTKATFVPETRGKGQDWVLVLDGGNREWKEITHLVK